MLFLPGDHALNTNITVTDIARLTMQGESSSGNIAKVVCNGSVGLSFTNMVEFKIYSLNFSACSRSSGGPPPSRYYALLLQSTQYAALVDCSFYDNIGNALVVRNTSVTLAGNSEFIHNHCESNSCIGGGGIVIFSSNVTITGNTTFLDNLGRFHGPTNDGGVAIYANNTILNSTGISNFFNNLARDNAAGCTIAATSNSVLTFNGNNNFINNSAQGGHGAGGAISISDNTTLTFNGNNNFINNLAAGDFGVGGAISITNNTILTFNGNNNFTNNSAPHGGEGGAIFTTSNTLLIFNGTNKFINNSSGTGGAIYSNYNVVIRFNRINSFINNSATNRGGAIYFIMNSTLVFNGTIYFTHNKVGGAAGYGGGVSMALNSTFSILPNARVYWENNHAAVFGGAIYFSDYSPISYCVTSGDLAAVASYIPKEECFFQLAGQNLSSRSDAQLIFKNNSADVAGNVLYGGVVDNCRLTGLHSYNNSGEVFDMLVHTDDNTTSNISSNPFHICPCKNNLPNCSEGFYNVPHPVYPGETFQVSVVAVGQRNGTVPTGVRSAAFNYVPKDKGDLLSSQYIQQVNNVCTKLNYTVFSLSQSMTIELRPDNSFYVQSFQCFTYEYHLLIRVNLTQTCPPGLNVSELEKSCVCEPRLAEYTQKCNITNRFGHITRDSGRRFWVGYDNESDGLILHPHCPFDYCVNDTVVVPLNNTDIQCAYDRSGLLCGACKNGYSLVLGSSICKQCTNNHLSLLIHFAVMGVALVFLLLVCKLTVATGTLSGLVLYANVVGVNRTIFLPVESTDAFTFFIAWLNLDFGIETCFYDGMDTYSKTWLQFVFPVYILMIVGLMVLVSHFSSRFARLLGNNPVSMLATLILLSYTKILRTLIAVLYITYLEYPTYNSMVWLYDANIDYLSGKHIPLFLVAVLVFLFLFLPYTFLLLFAQWLQAISHLRLFSWVNSTRLKAFMDSYHAPYKAKHRYWPGLLLILRVVLFLVFAFEFNPQQDRTSINLLAILVGIGILVVWAWASGGVCRNWCLDALEGSFALNLIILSAATMYIYHVSPSERDQLAVGYTSVSIAFATFIVILVFQVVKVTGIAQYLKMKCAAARMARDGEVEEEPQDIGSLPDRLVNPGNYKPQFYTPKGHTAAEPTEEKEMLNGAQRMLIPAYTYGSIN